ncbi:MAG: hypothetical protein WA964_01455 [Ilumatobacter sp.]|uniref:hypothetical protein n=1 Tax=Ilumatobacter sp. TaxID=1967498 RepID=UPI003C71CD29
MTSTTSSVSIPVLLESPPNQTKHHDIDALRTPSHPRSPLMPEAAKLLRVDLFYL